MITITENAKKYLYEIAKKNNKKFVSFGVSGGGCAGFSYKWDYIDEPDKGHTIFHIKDEVSLAVDKVALEALNIPALAVLCPTPASNAIISDMPSLSWLRPTKNKFLPTKPSSDI